MKKTEFVLKVYKDKLPNIRFVARLGNSDVFGIEQEYIMEPVESENDMKEVVEFNTDIIDGFFKPVYLTIAEAAKKFNITKKRLYFWCVSSRIVAYQKKKKGKWLIEEQSLKMYIEEFI